MDMNGHESKCMHVDMRKGYAVNEKSDKKAKLFEPRDRTLHSRFASAASAAGACQKRNACAM